MRIVPSATLAAVLVTVTVACGGGSAPPPETATPPPAAGGGASVSLDKNAYPAFPDPDSGADPAVPAEQGGRGFKGDGWEVRGGPEPAKEPPGKDIVGAHVRNFLECAREGKTPNADIEIGHASTRLCHLGNIAYRTGRTLLFDAKTETFPGDKEANQLLGREYRKGFELPGV